MDDIHGLDSWTYQNVSSLSIFIQWRSYEIQFAS